MIKNRTTFYDERNDRYLTTTGSGYNKVWTCEQREFDCIKMDYVFNDLVLMTEYELNHMQQVDITF